MAWDTARLRPVYPTGLSKAGGGVSSTVLRCEHRKLGIYREEYWIIPDPRFPAHLRATNQLKDYGHGYGLEALRIRLI